MRDRLKEGFADLGEKELKNIARPVRVFAIKTASSGVTQELIAFHTGTRRRPRAGVFRRPAGAPVRGSRSVRSRCLIILQKPLDVVELLLRAQHVAETAAQFFDDAAGTRHVDLARYFHRAVVAVFAPAQRTAERIGVLLRARLAEPAGASRAGTLPHLLLHRLRQTLRTLAQSLERAPLQIDRAVGVAFAEAALGLAHGFAGAAEVVDVALALALALLARLALLVRGHAAVFQVVEQLVQPVAQRLLALPQVAEGVPPAAGPVGLAALAGPSAQACLAARVRRRAGAGPDPA